MNNKILLARTETESNALRKQSLSEHYENVYKLMTNIITAFVFDNLKKLCAAGHDMGKAGKLWQDDLINSRHGRPHSYVFALWLYNKYAHDENSIKRLTAQIVGMAVWSHHGYVRSCADKDGIKYTDAEIKPTTYNEDEYNDCLNEFFQNCITETELEQLFESACGEVEFFINHIKDEVKDVYADSICEENALWFIIGLTERLLYSMLIDADRYDAACFKFYGNPLANAKKADWKLLSGQIENYINSFKIDNKTSEKIFSMRKEISCKCRSFADKNNAGIYRLYVPTGGGKTLSVMRYAAALSEKLGYDHIFYIAPYLTIIEQNAADCRTAFGLDKDSEILIEHHSNIVIDGDNPEVNSRLSERWDSPIIFTTMVQFLETLFSGDSQSARRMGALCNSVIVIDEAQNLPVKALYMFNTAMNFLRLVCGSTIVLCTATQPDLGKLRYPIKFSENSDIITDYDKLFYAFKRTDIINLAYGAHKKMTFEDLSAFAQEQLDRCGSVLVIVNTKRAARKIYELINGCDEKYHLSTLMCASHRKNKIREIKNKLNTKKRVICVSTQLIEAGVNISFGCVIRVICGLDSIAQAAGRCNRHGENSSFAPVYIVDLQDETLGSLEDIKIGQDCTRSVLDELKFESEKLNGDLISPKAIKLFYDKYYRERESEMSYSSKNSKLTDLTLFDMLGRNIKVFNAIKSKCRRARKPIPDDKLMYQSFREAGKEFKVIDNDSDTVGVIVPYKEGADLIAELNGSGDIQYKKSLLRKAQSYTLNLYRNDINKLIEAKALIQLRELDVYALDASFYSDGIGASDKADVDISVEDCIM